MSGDLGQRLQSVRKRRGLTQRELAAGSGVSVSFIRKIEQGERDDARIETLRRLAVGLGCPLTALIGSEPEAPESRNGEIWAETRRAIDTPRAPLLDEPVADGDVAQSLTAAVRLYHDNSYEELALVLPELVADSDSVSPRLRARILQLTGSVMVQTRQLRTARTVLERALASAESTDNALDAASVVVTMCWLLLVERRFQQVDQLAIGWADQIEPRMSTASERELSTWGWLLMRGSAAAVRDNRPDDADGMMRLAQAAAVAVTREQAECQDYWTLFGPATVAMKRVENAVIDDRPDLALHLAREVPTGLRPTSDNRNRHLLDVAQARLDLHHPDPALDILLQLSREARPWLIEQRLAKDLLARLIGKRRTLTPDMRSLADLIHLEY
ncbi:helix-turn-helix domain-containing protein [Nocardia sp. CDC160]|uniref:helix-turn-helix domain-containing protein n=1 Tax=Nocardia sp. CDC160 TaxID=3112166 RepID=UPI002DBAAACC|nr:helix-turn-helix transcriptional regulator [Nocardia sp. CDC160]MEC3917574.1 helix-turn-helix transcriptional regulator [Nocardia sp. CDC160]